MDMGGAWVNIADVLNTRRAHARGARGGAPGPRGGVEQPVADRRLAAALDRRVPATTSATGTRPRRYIPAESRRHTGGTLLLWQVGRATLALGRGDLALAEEALSVMDHAVAGMTEPQFVGPHGDHARRAGAPERGHRPRPRGDRRHDRPDRVLLGRHGPDHRGSRRRRCAWRATPASSRTTARTPRPSSHARERADALIERTRLAADIRAGRSRRRSWRRRRPSTRARRTAAAPATLWARAAAAWESLGRPYPVAYARWREAEALMAARDRDGAARGGLGRARPRAEGSGSAWLIEEIESLAARARLQLGDEAPAPAAAALERRRGRRPVRPDPARARRARPGRLRRNQPRDRRAAPHGGEDRQRARVPHPREAERALPHRGRRGCAPAGPGTSTADSARRATAAANDGTEGVRSRRLPRNTRRRQTLRTHPSMPPFAEPSACARGHRGTSTHATLVPEPPASSEAGCRGAPERGADVRCLA